MAPCDHHTTLLYCCAVLCAGADPHQALPVKAVDAHGLRDLLVQASRRTQLAFVVGAPPHLQTAPSQTAEAQQAVIELVTIVCGPPKCIKDGNCHLQAVKVLGAVRQTAGKQKLTRPEEARAAKV